MAKPTLINKQDTLFIDQYGGRRIWASSVRELCKKAGYSTAKKMYVDKSDGTVLHTGYVVGPHWFTAYRPVEIKA